MNIIYPNGSVTVSVPASARVQVYSEGDILIYQNITSVNFPTQKSLLSSAQGGLLTTSVFSSATTIEIEAGGAPAFYEVGTDAVVKQYALLSANALNTTGALTSAMILGTVVTSTTAAAVAGTVPTGAVLDDASSWEVGVPFMWSVINTGGSNTFTVTAASGHTLVGSAAVLAGITGIFKTVKTAADTFVTYRAG